MICRADGSDPVDFFDVVIYLVELDIIFSYHLFSCVQSEWSVLKQKDFDYSSRFGVVASLVERLWTFSRMLQSLFVLGDHTTAAYSM